MRSKTGMTLLAASALLAGAADMAAAQTLGTISVEHPETDSDLQDALPSFQRAVVQALAERGFMTLDKPGHAGLVAGFTLNQVEVGTGTARAARPGPPTVSIGGGAPGVGGGMTALLPNRKSRLVAIERTRLEIRIQKRGAAKIVWRGSATTVRSTGTAQGQDEAVAHDLAAAILRSYPSQSATLISIP